MLLASQTNPRVLRLAATLLHLSFHRYRSVAMSAAAALHSFSFSVSDGILRRIFPQLISAATLLREPSMEAGATALLSDSAHDASLERGLEELSALVEPALKGSSSSVGSDTDFRPFGSIEGSSTGGEVGVCTTGNKHLVKGALQLIQMHSGMISALCRRSATHFVALYMAVFVMQSFTLPVRRSCLPLNHVEHV
jgi:hypothetical protein